MNAKEPTERTKTIFELLNSKFILLLTGALLSGILVPVFQKNQERADWRNKTKYSELKYELDQKRLCLQEFINLTNYPPFAYDRLKRYLKDPLSIEQLDAAISVMEEEQQKRIQQNAKVMSLVLLNYKDNTRLVTALNKYIEETNKYLLQLEKLIEENAQKRKTQKDDSMTSELQVPNISYLEQFSTDIIWKMHDDISKISQMY